MSTKQTNKTFVGTSLADLLSIGPKCKQTIVSYSHKGKKKDFITDTPKKVGEFQKHYLE